jgi:hypothetical protein
MKSARPVLPAVGDVIRYAYLWSHESGAGREEGTKDRPAAIVALLRGDDGRDEVVVFPITSSPPAEAAAGVEIPAATRDRLGLQDGPCWVIVTEVNIFVWPGPDLRRPENPNDGFVYGSLPHALMLRIKQSFAAWRARGRVRAIRRSE